MAAVKPEPEDHLSHKLMCRRVYKLIGTGYVYSSRTCDSHSYTGRVYRSAEVDWGEKEKQSVYALLNDIRMTHSFLVLHDLTPHARQALRVAYQWSLWTGAELRLLHSLEAAHIPAMADHEVRQQLVTSSRTEAYNKLQQSYEEITGKPAKPENVHLSIKKLTASINELISLHDTQLLFAGLKPRGVLKRMIVGSTVLKLLEHVAIPVVAVPESMRELQQLTLHVAVNYRHEFNAGQLQAFMQLMGEKVAALDFFSVLTKDDDPEQAANQLAALKASFPDQATVSSCLFEGEAPFEQVKAYMKEQAGGVLVVQRGSRDLSDYLFRSFFINELVQDGSMPLIILP